jgi:hypothetical protein
MTNILCVTIVTDVDPSGFVYFEISDPDFQVLDP